MKRTFLPVYRTLMIISVIAMVSCGESEQKPSRTELLTAKNWTLSKIEIQSEAGTFDVSHEYLHDCQTDNILGFTKDGNYSLKVGSNNCDGLEEARVGTWAWKENETVLTKAAGTNLEEDLVTRITQTSLTLNVGKILYDQNGDGTEDAEVDLLYTYSKM